jgi:hypothetical protein
MEQISNEKTASYPVSSSLTTQSGKDFFRYLKNFNLAGEPGIMILPPNHHYYYDENDLKNIRTLINLKKINLIKDINTFFYTLVLILPPNANFIGCFSNTNKGNNGFIMRVFNRVINLLDLKTDYYIGKQEVSSLLEKHGFKIVDMTEMDDMIYFYSQKVAQVFKISA